MPEAQAPDIDDITHEYLLAFNVLSKGRQIGMSINALMVSEIITFYKELVWFCDDVLHFIHVMQGMDEIFIKFHTPEK